MRPSLRDLLRAATILFIGAVFSSPGAASAQPILGEPFPDTKFTIVAIPDTQINTTNPVWNQAFHDIVDWVVWNRDHRNIVFVTHLGDLTEGELGRTAHELQFELANGALSKLDGVIPYSATTGNHDFAVTGQKCSGVDLYLGFFGPERYVDRPWYGGYRCGRSVISREEMMDGAVCQPETTGEDRDMAGLSHYQVFRAGPFDFLHLTIEYKSRETCVGGEPQPTDAVWRWAQEVLDAHPNLPTILSSHEYLTDTDVGTGETLDAWLENLQGNEPLSGQRSGTGEFLWENIVRRNPQVFMTLNGHEHEGPARADGEYHQVSTNADALPVFEMLSNYQDWYNPAYGTEPYIRLIEFDLAAGRIQVRTFNPSMSKATGGLVLGDGGPRDQVLAAADPGEPLAVMPFQTDADSEFGFDVVFDAWGRPALAGGDNP